jgi:hypothetical protein
MRQFRGRQRGAGEHVDHTQVCAISNASPAGSAGRSVPGPGVAGKRAADTGGAQLCRSVVGRAIGGIALAASLFHASAYVADSVLAHTEASPLGSTGRAIAESPIADDCLVGLGHLDGRSDRHHEKRPLALRKHARLPSPSDDDGTCPDPTDEDESSEDGIEDGTEAAFAHGSPPIDSFVLTLERSFAPSCVATATPLYLALQRFRC